MRIAPQVQAEVAVILAAYSAWACERNTTSFTSVRNRGLDLRQHAIEQRGRNAPLLANGRSRVFKNSGGYEPSQASAHRAPGR